jgi:hypothetical protein
MCVVHRGSGSAVCCCARRYLVPVHDHLRVGRSYCWQKLRAQVLSARKSGLAQLAGAIALMSSCRSIRIRRAEPDIGSRGVPRTASSPRYRHSSLGLANYAQEGFGPECARQSLSRVTRLPARERLRYSWLRGSCRGRRRRRLFGNAPPHFDAMNRSIPMPDR